MDEIVRTYNVDGEEIKVTYTRQQFRINTGADRMTPDELQALMQEYNITAIVAEGGHIVLECDVLMHVCDDGDQ